MSALLTPEQVFVTDGFPRETYVTQGRGEPEAEVREGLAQLNKIISIVGASKTGKSTLCDRLFGTELGKSKLLVTGDQISDVDHLWTEAYRQAYPGQLPFSAANIQGAIIDKLIERNIPLVLDDFHYVDKDVRLKISQQMKNVAARGLRFVVLNTPHRLDDPIRNNPDLSGRFFGIDLGFWSLEDLMEIGKIGFPKVGLKVSEDVLQILAAEALRSPQLMQTLCLETCRVLPQDKPYEQQEVMPLFFDLQAVKKKTVRSYDNSTALEYLRKGPDPRGTARNTFTFTDGSSGDVYNAIVRALALDPPFVTVDLNEIKERVKRVVISGGEPNVTAALSNIDGDLWKDVKAPLEWDKKQLTIIDPHFYFYLRYIGK